MDLTDIGKLPIAGDNPAGYDVRTSEIYEQLATEINKRVTVTSGGVVDWALVVKLSQDILQNHSKDLLVCSYLCIGLLNTSGLKGFAAGLHIFSELLETYWSNLFPPRINGRINAIDWWISTANEQFRKIKGESWSEDEIGKLNQDFDSLIKFFNEHEIEQATDIRVMQSTCKHLVSTAQAPVAEVPSAPISDEQPVASEISTSIAAVDSQAPVTNTPTPTTQVFKPEAVNLPDNINVEDIGRALAPIFSALGKISNVIYEQQPLSYQLFRINRFCAWININSLPLSDKDGKTMLPPPESYLVSFAQKLYQEKKWMELLKYAEARIVEFRFWLDLSYYVHTALINLNAMESASELAYEMLIFTKRVIGVEKLTFSDGMPFADSETLEWIASLGDNEGSGGTSNKLIGDDEEWTKAVGEAQQLVAKGDLSLALNKLHYRIQSAGTKRAKFLRMLYFCQFANLAKQADLVKAYIYEILDNCNKYQLELWEPNLVSEAYQLMLNIARQKKVKFGHDEIERILNRLSVIDPVNALKFHNK